MMDCAGDNGGRSSAFIGPEHQIRCVLVGQKQKFVLYYVLQVGGQLADDLRVPPSDLSPTPFHTVISSSYHGDLQHPGQCPHFCRLEFDPPLKKIHHHERPVCLRACPAHKTSSNLLMSLNSLEIAAPPSFASPGPDAVLPVR